MRISDWSSDVCSSDLSLVLLFAAVTIAYLADAWTASGGLRNRGLLVPVSALSLMLCALVVVDVVRRARAAPEVVPQEESPAPVGQSFIDRYKPAVLMALFALYVLTLPWLGFDVGSAVFVAAALVMDGERRLWLIEIGRAHV